MDVGDGFTLQKKIGHTESFDIPGILKNSYIYYSLKGSFGMWYLEYHDIRDITILDEIDIES